MNRILEAVATWMATIGGMTVALLMMLILADAFGRKLGMPVPGALEFSEAAMVLVVFLPLMYVQMRGEHVFVGALTQKLPQRVQAFLDGMNALIGVGIFALLTWLATEKAWEAWLANEYRVAAVNVPIWPFRWLIPLGTGLLSLQLVLTALEELTEATGRSGHSAV